MSEAAFISSVVYTDASGVQQAPHFQVVRAAHSQQTAGDAVLADAATANTAIVIDFGSIATEATGFVIKNNTRQDLTVGFNGTALPTAITTFEAVLATQLAILNAFTTGTAIATVIAAIATANTAISSARTTLNTAKAAPAFTMPHGAVLSYSTPTAAGTPMASLSLFATATQSGKGYVSYKVFGA